MKTVKTAGTSVEVYFEKYCMPENEYSFSHQRKAYFDNTGIVGFRGKNGTEHEWYNHMPAFKVKEKIGHELWDEYLTFSVIRNPFDKMVSGFFFRKAKGWVQVFYDNVGNEDLIASFRYWVKSSEILSDRTVYMIDGTVCVDYFIRFEDLNKGIKHVCGLLDIPFEPDKILFLKNGFRDRMISFDELYDQETIDIVQKKYSFELDYFSYDFPVGQS